MNDKEGAWIRLRWITIICGIVVGLLLFYLFIRPDLTIS